ncbi:MAG: hypothetical protein IPL49_11220 [Saprospirales bacterium]|nr:hypothetical protein [Saprospirales bacterium]
MDYPKNGLSNGQHNHPPPEEEKDQLFFLDTRSLIFRLLRNWYLFAIGIALAVGYVKFKARYVVPVYQVRSTMIVNSGGRQELDLGSLLGGGGGSSSSGDLTNELTVLKSRTLMRKVVDSLGLNVSYFVEGRVKTTEFYGNTPVVLTSAAPSDKAYGKTLRIDPIDDKTFNLVLNEDKSLPCTYGEPFSYAEATWLVDYRFMPVDGAQILIKNQWPDAVAGSLAGSLVIDPVIRSNVVKLGMNSPNADKAKAIVNKLIEVYSDDIIQKKNEANLKTLAFVNERLDFVTRELYDVEKTSKTSSAAGIFRSA